MVILSGLLKEIGAILQHEKGSGAPYQQVSADELSIEEHFAAIIALDMHLLCTRINTYICSNIPEVCKIKECAACAILFFLSKQFAIA
jgi:hypothetical protein